MAPFRTSTFFKVRAKPPQALKGEHVQPVARSNVIPTRMAAGVSFSIFAPDQISRVAHVPGSRPIWIEAK